VRRAAPYRDEGAIMTQRTPPNTIPWPPVIYLIAAASAVVLHQAMPLPWLPDGALRIIAAGTGLCLICAAIALDVAAMLAFRRHRTTIMPHRSAAALITEGPFAKSRNPIYLGNTMLVFGAGLLLGIVWLLPAAVIAAAVVQKLAIAREERHLAESFGRAWTDYAARTPRWLFFKD
jgi:protein-S-isoprenylcysteine O-methyltransferase Ste14